MTSGRRGGRQVMENRGQQDKRPRHVCAAKSLSAHPFFRHAPRIEPCRLVANRIKALSIGRAYYDPLRSTWRSVIDEQIG